MHVIATKVIISCSPSVQVARRFTLLLDFKFFPSLLYSRLQTQLQQQVNALHLYLFLIYFRCSFKREKNKVIAAVAELDNTNHVRKLY